MAPLDERAAAEHITADALHGSINLILCVEFPSPEDSRASVLSRFFICCPTNLELKDFGGGTLTSCYNSDAEAKLYSNILGSGPPNVTNCAYCLKFGRAQLLSRECVRSRLPPRSGPRRPPVPRSQLPLVALLIPLGVLTTFAIPIPSWQVLRNETCNPPSPSACPRLLLQHHGAL